MRQTLSFSLIKYSKNPNKKIEFLLDEYYNNYMLKMTTTDKLETGYQYICNNNLITNFLNYQMTESDIYERKISRLDNFHIFPPNTEENIALNIDIKWDLENIAKTGSRAGLSEYIFDLIIYARGATGSNMNPSCAIC